MGCPERLRCLQDISRDERSPCLFQRMVLLKNLELRQQKNTENRVTVKNRIRSQVNFIALQRHYGGTPSKYQSEYLENFAFFSSNACLFYHQTDLDKNDCPTGIFLCQDSAGKLNEGHNSTYNEAVVYCNERNSSLSKYQHF